MKLDKKCGLVLFNVLVFTFAVIFIISLSRGTTANDETPANLAFDDINFYKCVVDVYNVKNGTSVEYTVNLTDEELESITELICSNDGKSDEYKITSVVGIEKLTSLTSVNLSYNLLNFIDVSAITGVESLNVSNNQLTNINLSKNILLT